MAHNMHAFEDRAALASALADRVSADLKAAIAARGTASLAVSGGSTPKQFFEALVASSPVAVVTMDRDEIVTGWNPAAERLFGWSVEEAAGQLLTDLVVPEQYRAAHHEGLRRRAAGGAEGRVP